MNTEQIINQEAYELGLKVKGSDRKLIQNKLSITESGVNAVLTGKRKAVRGKSLAVVELARKIADINENKAELI